VEGEGVAHGVQHLHPVQVQPVDRGADRDRPGGHHQPVIGQRPPAAIPTVGDGDLLAGRLDRSGGVVQPQLDTGLFQVGGGAVSQVAPVGHVAREVVGQPTDGEVGIGVGHNHGDLDSRVELAGSQRSCDAAVAAPDD